MSKQGNIVVRVDCHFSVTLATGLWIGKGTAEAVQRALECPYDEGCEYWEPHQGWKNFLQALIKDDCVSHPIAIIGNCDTPTVIVDFTTNTVFWYLEEAELTEESWSFREYLELDIPKLALFKRYFAE